MLRFILTAATVWTSVAAAQRTERDSLTWQGLKRTYTVHLPRMAGTRAPLLVLLHGRGGNARTVMQRTGFEAKADSVGFVLVAPDGTGDPRGWYTGFGQGGVIDDVGFIAALLDTLIARYPIDRARVYVAGYSNGGVLAHWLASDLSKRIAATAVFAGAIGVRSVNGHEARIDPPRAPVPMLIMHGDADSVIPYAAASGPLPAVDGATFWARANECGVLTPRRDSIASGRVLREVWETRCRAPVVFLTLRGGDHGWPSTSRGAPIEAADVIWEFLREYRR